MGANILLLDLGNTRIKWHLYSQEESRCVLVQVGHFLWESQRVLLNQLPECEVHSVAYSSVADPLIGEAIERLCLSRWQIKPIKAEIDTSILPTHYERVDSLGVDRWLAVLAARSAGSALVVDAGSAITLDWLNSGIHTGGYIAPGVALMAESLHQFTARLPQLNSEQLMTSASLSPGVSTVECMTRGAWAALVGIVQEALAQQSVSKLYITGGDGAKLTQLLAKSSVVGHSNVAMHHSSDLVFQGLLEYLKIKNL